MKPKALYSQKVNKHSLKMKNEEKVLALLLREAGEKYSINQLAKKIKISVGSAHKILKDFERRKIVIADRIANAVLYRINFKNKEARKLCELLLIKDKAQKLEKNKYAKIYSEDLKQFESLADICTLFGSILTKREKARDVDVLFITKKAEAVVDKCADISKSRTKTINPLIMNLKDFREKLIEKDAIVINILKNGVVLFGEEEIIKLL